MRCLWRKKRVKCDDNKPNNNTRIINDNGTASESQLQKANASMNTYYSVTSLKLVKEHWCGKRMPNRAFWTVEVINSDVWVAISMLIRQKLPVQMKFNRESSITIAPLQFHFTTAFQQILGVGSRPTMQSGRSHSNGSKERQGSPKVGQLPSNHLNLNNPEGDGTPSDKLSLL